MGTRRMILSAIGLTALVGTVRAGPVTTFTDLDTFLAAAGDVREIDFETLPDGSPSYSGALITPEFNYTDQGVLFSPASPLLRITGNPISGFHLDASLPGSGGPRNWIIAEFVEPATAVGILYPGGTSLSLFDTQGHLLGGWLWGSCGDCFLGALSVEPIGSVIIDARIEVELIDSFFFTPIPEPATLVLLASGAVVLLRRRRC